MIIIKSLLMSLQRCLITCNIFKYVVFNAVYNLIMN